MSHPVTHRRAGPKCPPYRITLVGKEWHVTQPQASLSHAFAQLSEAETFVCNDNGGAPVVIEIVAGTVCTLKAFEPDSLSIARFQPPDESDNFPTPHEVLGEIGLALAVHLTFAAAVVMALQILGIA
jgi:hypothetical protein